MEHWRKGMEKSSSDAMSHLTKDEFLQGAILEPALSILQFNNFYQPKKLWELYTLTDN